MTELIVVILYIALIFLVALSSRIKLRSETGKALLEEQYLANKSLNFIEAICSIVATETSALTFLGLPAFAFAKDFSFINIYLGAIVGRILIAQIEVPLVYNKGLTLYQVIAESKASSQWSKRLLSLIYSITKILGVGVRLYMGSILLSSFFQVSIEASIFLTVALSLIYTSIGGLKAVVRTDLLQMVLLLSGGVLALYLIPETAGESFSNLLQKAHLGGKTKFLVGNEFYYGFFGGIIFDIGTHGMDQDYMQRLMACRSMKTAQRAITYSTILSLFSGLLFLTVGALLWSLSQEMPFPSDLKNDQVFAYFITEYFPSPVKGFMLAGVLAATMSTLDSTINAVSSCLSNDILNRDNFLNIKRGVLVDLVVIAGLLVTIAIFASEYDQVLILGLKIASWIGGFFISIFVSQVLFKKTFLPLDSIKVLILFGVSLLCVWGNTYLSGPWQFNPFWGFLGSFSMSFVLDFFYGYRKV